MSRIFRVVWQERTKKKCSCCVDSNHDWETKSTEDTLHITTFEDADRVETKTYGIADDGRVEIRNIQIQYADITEWKDYNDWEHK